jgi:hypothetical protein
MKKIQTDNKFKLTEYLKYDSSLGRDQQIDIGKASSLISQENLRISHGVKLTEFLPEKHGSKDLSDHESDHNIAQMSFEQRMEKREKDIKTGRVMERQVSSIRDGGKYNAKKR